MVDFQFLREGVRVWGQWYPILKMEWVEGEPLIRYLRRNLQNPTELFGFATKFLQMMLDLQQRSIAHGDIQHGNILVTNKDIRLIDYDGMFVPELAGLSSHELGNPNYQHPARRASDFGSYLDHFSVWVVLTSLAGLIFDQNFWDRFNAGDDCLLFRREDFIDPDSSAVLQELRWTVDPNVKALTDVILSLLRQTSIATLGAPSSTVALPQPAAQPATVPVGGSGGAAWIKDYNPRPIPAPLALDGAAQRGSYIAAGFVASELGLMLARFAYAIPVDESLVLMMASVVVAMACWWLHFSSLPRAQERSRIQSNINGLRKVVGTTNMSIRGIEKSQVAADAENKRHASEVGTKQRQLNEHEKREIDGIDRDFLTAITKPRAELQALMNQQSSELAQALGSIREQALISALLRYDLSSATIAGVGPKQKASLAAAGVRTAADILGVTNQAGRYSSGMAFIQIRGQGARRVPGIGPAKASALMSWRRQLENVVSPSIPQSLPSSQEAAIRSKFAQRIQQLTAFEQSARQDADAKKARVRTNYRGEQDLLRKELQSTAARNAQRAASLQRELALQKGTLERVSYRLEDAKREMEAYRLVTFPAYLRSAFLFGG
jgi:hypothetical protein